jgi:hypothetical protein
MVMKVEMMVIVLVKILKVLFKMIMVRKMEMMS